MKVERYAKKRFRKLRDHIEKYGRAPDIEILHEIRLEIKKLKSLLQLAEFSIRGFKAHQHYKPIRVIFRKAGMIREPEVFFGLLLRYEIDGIADARVPQAIEEAQLSVEFRQLIPSFYLTIGKNEKKLLPVFRKIRGGHIERYLKSLKRQLRKQLKASWTRSVLHKSRKMAKQIIYLSAVQKRANKRIKPFYELLQENIGMWHDKHLLLPVLKEQANPQFRKMELEMRADIRRLKALVAKHDHQ